MFSDNHPIAVTAPPRGRWRFWLLLIGGPLLVLVLSGVAWMIRANVGLQAAVDEADRLDPRWRLEEIEADRAMPPPGQNAAEKIAAMGPRAMAFRWPNETIGRFSVLVDESPQRQLNAEQKAAVKDSLAIGKTVLAEARSLIDTPRGRRLSFTLPIGSALSNRTTPSTGSAFCSGWMFLRERKLVTSTAPFDPAMRNSTSAARSATSRGWHHKTRVCRYTGPLSVCLSDAGPRRAIRCGAVGAPASTGSSRAGATAALCHAGRTGRHESTLG